MVDIKEDDKIIRGVRTGRILSPTIFNAYIQKAINIMREEFNLGKKFISGW